MNVPVFYRGQTIVLSAAITEGGVAVDPDTSVTVTVTNPSGTKVVDGQTMTKGAVGSYTYDYTVAADAAEGLYEFRVRATDGSRVTISGDTFKVIA